MLQTQAPYVADKAPCYTTVGQVLRGGMARFAIIFDAVRRLTRTWFPPLASR